MITMCFIGVFEDAVAVFAVPLNAVRSKVGSIARVTISVKIGRITNSAALKHGGFVCELFKSIGII